MNLPDHPRRQDPPAIDEPVHGIHCSACQADVRLYARSRVRRRYPVCYYECIRCGFVQSETPFWLGEAYADVIGSDDVGIISRNLWLSRQARVFSRFLLPPGATALDYGGGHGLLVRMMRDNGYDFRWFDQHCPNLFARGFTGNLTTDYALITAFEVLEHIERPLELVATLMARTPYLLFSTVLLPNHRPKPEDWWYFNLQSGQHISFFTSRALSAMAAKLGVHVASNGRNLHLLSRRPMRWSRLLFNSWLTTLLAPLVRRGSLQAQDYRFVLTTSDVTPAQGERSTP